MSAPQRSVPHWKCQCGKAGYLSRRDAKRVAKLLNRRDLNAYTCQHDTETLTWHLGHLPTVVSRGRATRADIGQAIR